MPAWLGPAVGALGGVVGGLFGNQSNRRESDRNRDFQERMSSTAAQRSAEDFRAAGLNPALAYDRPASSPGGSQAQQEDVLGKGLSTGMQAKQLAAQIELTKAQTEKVQSDKALVDTDISLRTMSGEGEPSWRDEQLAARQARLRDLTHQGKLQPHDERLRALQVMLAKAGLTAADFKAESLSDLDAVRDFIKNGVSSAGDAARAFAGWKSAGESRVRGMSQRLQQSAEAAARAARERRNRRNNSGGW